MKATSLDSTNFDSTLASTSDPVLVDFWAPWCGPCQMLGPVIDEIAAETADRALVAKVNVDDARDLARRFEVKSIPTLLVIKDGQVIERLGGVQTKSRILTALAAA